MLEVLPCRCGAGGQWGEMVEECDVGVGVATVAQFVCDVLQEHTHLPHTEHYRNNTQTIYSHQTAHSEIFSNILDGFIFPSRPWPWHCSISKSPFEESLNENFPER